MPDRRTVFNGALLFFTAAVIVAGAVYLTFRLGTIIIWVALAWILSSGLAPLVRRIERCAVFRVRLTRSQAVLIVFFGLLAAIAGLALLVGVPATRQVRLFLQDSNQYLYQVSRWWHSVQSEMPWLPDLTGAVDRVLAYIKARSTSEPEIAQLGLRFLKGVGGLVTVLVLTLYMLLLPPRFDRLADLMAPEQRRLRLRSAFGGVTFKFQRWLRAQLILSATIGSITFAGLLVLRIPYPHFLALVAAIGELIPIAGPILAAIPAVVVALSQSGEQAIAVAAFAFMIQMFENYFLVPRIMRDVVGVPPLVTILGLLIGSELFGVLGAMLAVPVAAALGILIPEVIGALAAPTPLSEAAGPPVETPAVRPAGSPPQAN